MKQADENSMASMIHLFEVHGMECASCINKVYRALTSISGIRSAKVSLDPPHAEVVMDRHVAIEKMNEALKLVGEYTLESLATTDGQKRKNVTVDMLLRKESFFQLVLLLGFLIGGVALREINRGYFDGYFAIRNLIGGLLTVFAFLKLLDIQAFAKAYQSYDLISRHSRVYAFAYPVIELILGLLYLTGLDQAVTGLLVILLMTIGAVGAFKFLRNKGDILDSGPRMLLDLSIVKVTLVANILTGSVLAFGLLLFR